MLYFLYKLICLSIQDTPLKTRFSKKKKIQLYREAIQHHGCSIAYFNEHSIYLIKAMNFKIALLDHSETLVLVWEHFRRIIANVN